jgi:DNA-binding MarR family transcriptional regulator
MARKELIDNLLNNFQVVKNRMHAVIAAELNSGITTSQWFVLCSIERNKNFGIKELAQVFGISSSAGTQLVNALVKDAYVVRSTGAKDRRELDLKLSKKGKKIVLQLRKKQVAMAKEFFKGLNDKELKQFVTLQNKLISKV